MGMLKGQGAKRPRHEQHVERRCHEQHVERRWSTGHGSGHRATRITWQEPSKHTWRGADQPESMYRSTKMLRDDHDQQYPSFSKGFTTAVLVDSTP